MAEDWDIKPRGSACGACASPFRDGEPCFSALVFDREGYSRADYCAGCWERRPRETAAFSTWQSRYCSPPPPPAAEPTRQTAESLLRRLMETRDPANSGVVYILAVMLERRRILAERGVRQEDGGGRVLVYEHRASGETFLIPDPQLTLEDLGPVQEQVAGMLGPGEPAGPGAAPSPSPAPAATDGVAAAGRTAGLREGFYTRGAAGQPKA
jgi:hypothetical protein